MYLATRTKVTYLISKYDSSVVRKSKKSLIAVGHKRAYKELSYDVDLMTQIA